MSDPVCGPSSDAPVARGVGALVAGVAVFFAVWAVIETAVTALGGSLNTLLPGLAVALAMGLAAAVVEYRHGHGFPQAQGGGVRADRPGLRQSLALASGVAALTLMVCIPEAMMVGWLGLVAAAAALAMMPWPPDASSSSAAAVAPAPHGRRDALVLAICVIAAVTVTLLSNRSDDDDRNYLRMAVRLLIGPDSPIYGQMIRANVEHIYRWHPYEALVAALVRLNFGALLPLYYHWLPALHAVMVVMVLYLCARPFIGGDAAWVALIAVVMLMAWGDVHRGTGNFAFVRLFQGKAGLASWGLPLVVLAAMRLSGRPGLWSATLLAASLGCAFALGHTALAVAPMAALLGGVAGWPRRFGWKAVTLTALVLMVPFLSVLAVEGLAAGYLRPSPKTATEALGLVFPPTYRSVWALTATLVAGLLLCGRGGAAARRMGLLGALLAFNPPLMALVSRMAESMSWRVTWTYPFAVMAAVAVWAVFRFEQGRGRPPLIAASVLVGFLFAGPWTLSSATGNQFGTLDARMSPVVNPPLAQVITILGGAVKARPLLYGPAEAASPRSP